VYTPNKYKHLAVEGIEAITFEIIVCIYTTHMLLPTPGVVLRFDSLSVKKVYRIA
jgi:hypothetical protein